MRANRVGIALISVVLAAASLCACSGPTVADVQAQFARGEFEASARSAQLVLQDQLERGASPDERWQVQHLRLLALAHAGHVWAVLSEWRTTERVYESCITTDVEAELVAALIQAQPGGRLGEQFQKLLISYPSTPDRSMPFGHPEGFPEAWLPPEEPGDEIP